MHKILILVPVIPVPVQAQRLDSAYPQEEEEVLLLYHLAPASFHLSSRPKSDSTFANAIPYGTSHIDLKLKLSPSLVLLNTLVFPIASAVPLQQPAFN
eukprot:scaffold1917_cov131-Skeletonema_marinoi.AAC.5